MPTRRLATRIRPTGPTPPSRPASSTDRSDAEPIAAQPPDSLCELSEWTRDDNVDVDTARIVLAVGATAWNLALLPRSQRTLAMRELRQELEECGHLSADAPIAKLTRRKRRECPHDRRLITRFDVIETPEGPNRFAAEVDCQSLGDDGA